MRPARYLIVAPLLTAALSARPVCADEGLRTFGDVMQIALPAAGGAATLILDDKQGQLQWLESAGTAVVTTQGIKMIVNKPRPDQNGGESFPSGHTSAAFMGASFIQRRYGWAAGAPAYAAAVVTAYSRIDADAHDFWDVLFGAAIGVGSTYIFTTPFEVGDTAFMITPVVGEDVYGIQFTLGEGVHRPIESTPAPKPPVDPDQQRNIQVTTGTDPTNIVGRLELSLGLADQNPDASRVTGGRLALRFDYAFGKQRLAGIEVAGVRNTAGTFEGLGIGDLTLRYLDRPLENIDAEWWQPRAFAWGLDTVLPTGDVADGTGRGQLLLRPKASAAFTPVRNLNFYPTLSYVWSAWNDNGPLVTNTSAVGLSFKVEYKFPNGVYFFWDPELFVPVNDAPTAFDNQFELGWQINRSFGVYLRYTLLDPASPMVIPSGVPNSGYDDVATFGIRWFY